METPWSPPDQNGHEMHPVQTRDGYGWARTGLVVAAGDALERGHWLVAVDSEAELDDARLRYVHGAARFQTQLVPRPP